MTPVFTARRRAEEFDALVEGVATGSDTRYAEFLDIVASLRELPPVEARPEFVADLRTQLMAAADTFLVPGEEERPVVPARKSARDRRIAAAVGGFALVGATTSMAMAAQTALPGDALYPLKRALENAEAGLTVDEGDKGVTLLGNASGRLEEVSALSRSDELEDTEAIAATLDIFTEQTTEASDLLLADYASTGSESSVSELRDFTATSMQTLAGLEAVVPADARDELLHAARALTQIDADAERACPSCAGPGITEIPAILTTGFSSRVSPVKPATELQPVARKKQGDRQAQQPSPQLPATQGQGLPPGSVLGQTSEQQPGQEPGQGPGDGPADSPVSNPLGDLTDDLIEGDGSKASTEDPELPDVSELEDAVEDVIDPITGQLP